VTLVTRRLTRGRDYLNLEGATPSRFGGLLVVHTNRSAGRVRIRLNAAAIAAAFILLAAPSAASAYAWHSDPSLPSGTREVRGTTTYDCSDCHVTEPGGSDEGSSALIGAGPHGYYRSDTNKCRMCHAVHNAPVNSMKLLPTATIQDTCFTCHDATGAKNRGVYSSITFRGGSVAASHSIDTTSHVPGGSVDLTTQLTCTSCHSVHRATTVAAFRTDQALWGVDGGPKESNALLRDDVGGKPRGTYQVYGSDWCAGCHDQRHSDSTVVMNHPVESSTTPGAFNYGRVATVLDGASSLTEIRDDVLETAGWGLGWTNLGYVMPYPRTIEQYPSEAVQHKPICQQCHEDPRNVGNVGSVVEDFSNPARPQTGQSGFSFPHQTETIHMVVESGDDLCMNCHPEAQLP
jgi:predicted CXXCH cytochrome family protein